MLTLRRLKVPVPGLHLTNGLPRGEGLLFFPGLRRGACQEDVEASGPRPRPAGRLTDAGSCAGAGVQGAQGVQGVQGVPARGGAHRTPRRASRCPPDPSARPFQGPGTAAGPPRAGPPQGQLRRPEQESGYSRWGQAPGKVCLGKLTGQGFLPASCGSF